MLASLALVTLAASTLATPLDAGTLEARQAARTGVIVPGLVCGSNPLVAAGVRALDSGSYKIGDGENLFLQIGARFFLADWQFPTGNKGPIKITSGGITKCIDAGSNPVNGVTLKIWECYDGLPQQQWKINEESIELVGYNLCFDLRNGNTSQGFPNIQTWQCAPGNPNQIWLTGTDNPA